MTSGLLLGVAVLAALACPLMVWLGRRGIGPGCALMGCQPRRKEETVESLRSEQEQLGRRLAAFEARQTAAPFDRERV